MSPKNLPLRLLKQIRHDISSTTGSSLRNIMLLLGKVTIDQIRLNDINNFEYSSVLYDNQWKVDMVREIIDIQADQLNIDNFSRQELDEM
jgi:hypothetical protein